MSNTKSYREPRRSSEFERSAMSAGDAISSRLFWRRPNPWYDFLYFCDLKFPGSIRILQPDLRKIVLMKWAGFPFPFEVILLACERNCHFLCFYALDNNLIDRIQLCCSIGAEVQGSRLLLVAFVVNQCAKVVDRLAAIGPLGNNILVDGHCPFDGQAAA
jgi:hypothetical protein